MIENLTRPCDGCVKLDVMTENLARPCDACGKPIGDVIGIALNVRFISAFTVAIN